jgi:hypothetical protein
MSSTRSASKGWNVSLWIAQVLLTCLFGMAGFMKATQPYDALNKAMPWTIATGEPLVRFIGTAELAGAVGLLLPALTRVLPFLTPLAGAGLTTIMILASAFHASRGELGVIPLNAVLGSLALFVAWGRFRKVPIQPRSAATRTAAAA